VTQKQVVQIEFMKKVVGGDKNGKGLYRHIRNTKVGAREIPTLKDDDTLFDTDKEKADSLQDFYKSVFQTVLEPVPPTDSGGSTGGGDGGQGDNSPLPPNGHVVT
jgi:hypothetical protein